MLTDDEIVIVVVASCAGAFLLGLFIFHSVYERLPHWMTNLLRWPPQLSCGPYNSKTAAFDHTRVTTRVVFVSVVPLIVAVVLLSYYLYAEVDLNFSYPSYHNTLDSMRCSRAVTLEHSLAVASFLSKNQAELERYRVAKERSDTDCSASVRSRLAAARSRIERGTVSHSYDDVLRGVRDAAAASVFGTFTKVDQRQIAEVTGLDLYASEREMCSVLTASLRKNMTFKVVPSTGMYPLALEPWMLTNVYPVFANSATSEELVEKYISVQRSPTFKAAKAAALQTMAVNRDWVPPSTSALHKHVTNMTALISLFGDRTAMHLNPNMEDSYKTAEERYVTAVAICIAALLLLTACAVANAAFIWNHRTSMRGAIEIRSAFESAISRKEVLNGYLNDFETLHVEHLGNASASSMVERPYLQLGQHLLRIKPLLPHSLFHGDIDEQDDDGECAAGRTFRYPVKLDLGLHFSNSTFMLVGTRSFHVMSKECMLNPDAVLEDFNLFINMVLSSSSRHKGVVDHIGGDSICCTWNCTLSCEKYSERAVQAAFDLQDSYGASFQPVDDPLEIILATGPVLSGAVKAGAARFHIILGPCLMIASGMTTLPSYFGCSIIADNDTLRKAHMSCGKPLFCLNTREGDVIFNEVIQKSERKPNFEERLREYREAFTLYRKGKRQEAIEALQQYLSKCGKGGDRCADLLLRRLKAGG